jgi:hypothetical protein
MDKISWTDCVKNEEVLHTVKEERNILHSMKRRKGNLIISCTRTVLQRMLLRESEKDK